MPDHLVDGGEAQTRHHAAQLLGDEQHEPLDVLGLTGEAVAQAAVLRGDAGRARVLLAVALHEAPHGDERHGGEAELLGAQQARHGDVGAVHELAVRLEHHAGAQAVAHERLLCLGKAELQRQAGVPDGIARGRARAAVVARDQDLVGGTLGDAGGDGSHARSLTSLTLTRARGLAHLRSKMSSARSSME